MSEHNPAPTDPESRLGNVARSASGNAVSTTDAADDLLPQLDNHEDKEGLPPALLEFHSPTSALINLPPMPAARYMVWLVGAMVVFFGIGLATFPLDRVVMTPGYLVATESALVVQPLDTAIVRSIDVREGDFVRKGQALAHLDPTSSDADLNSYRSQTESFQAQVDRLTAEAKGVPYKVDLKNPASTEQQAAYLRRKQEFQAKLDEYDHQIAQAQNQLQAYRASAAVYAARTKVAADVHNMRVKLQQDQVGSRLSTLSARDQLMEMERSQIEAQQNANAALSRMKGLQAERRGYIESWYQDVYKDLTQAQRGLYEARSGYEKAKVRKAMVVLHADQDAVVLTISKVSPGSVVSPGNTLMTLTPAGSGLEVEARLRGQDAGFVDIGNKAIIKFNTFPYVQYGGAEATVRSISADAFSGERDPTYGQGGVPRPVAGGDPNFYRIRFHIDRYTLRGVPRFFHPGPGLPVVANIKVGKRTPLQYLLNSVIPVATNGMRDP